MNIPILERRAAAASDRAATAPPSRIGMFRLLGTTFILALREIRRHLMRSFLTTLGIVIGVTAVVTMVSLGKGTTKAVQQQISSLGTNLLQVFPGQGFGRGGGGPPPPPFKWEDMAAIRDQVAGITAVAPQVRMSVTAVYNASNWTTTVNGTTADFFRAQQWPLSEGRIFMPAEEQAGKAVCVIGNTIRTKLFGQTNPVGERLRLGDVSCQVIGLLSTRGQAGFGQDQDDTVVMPVKAVQRRITGSQSVGSIMVSVDPSFDTAVVQASISSLLRERRNITGGKEDDFTVFDAKQISDAFSQTTRVMTGLLGAVAAVSLLVGGIGIMNIMLVSVTERTREIGIRLAIGAVASEVLLQFLVEAVVLSCLGGMIGLVLALLGTIGLSHAVNVPFIFDPQINLLAFAVSAIIGMVFGYFPARRAAALNPIDALRHE